MYHTNLALCVSCVCLLKKWWQYIKKIPTRVCTSTRHASITVVNMSVLCLFPWNMRPLPSWSGYIQSLFSYKYDSDASTFSPPPVQESMWFRFSFTFLSGGRFPTIKSLMGCPLPLSLSLTPLSVGTGGTKVPSVLTLGGIRRGGSRDAIRWLRMRLVWGLCKSRDARQPVNLKIVNLRWFVEWF